MRGKPFTLEGAPLATVRSYVIRRLALRSFSTQELSTLLRKKKAAPELIEATVEEFLALGYLNDEAWLESFLAYCSRKKLSPHAIAQKLYQKGYSQTQIETITTPLDTKASLTQLLATKYKNRDLANYKERQKVIASLSRKGFSLEDIFSALDLT